MAGGRGKLRPEDNPKPWVKGQSGNPNGRPVKIFSELSKEFKARGIERAGPAAVQEAYEYLLALPLSEIVEIAGGKKDYQSDNNQYPALLRIAAKKMLGKQGNAVINEMLDRAHGKAKQAIDHTSGGDKIGNPLDGLSPEKLEQVLLLLYNENS